jgi:hypothetical protein
MVVARKIQVWELEMKTLWPALFKVVSLVVLLSLLSVYSGLLPLLLFFPIVAAPVCLFLIFQLLQWLRHALDEIEPPFPKHRS